MTKIDPQDYIGSLAKVFGDLPDTRKAELRSKGEKYAKEGMLLHVGQNGVWWGEFPPETTPGCVTTKTVQSYEKLGYHSGTDQFLLGFLSAQGRCFFHNFAGISGEVTL